MGEIEVIATTPLESKSYVDLTIAVLETFQAKVKEEVGHYYVRSQGLKSPGEVTIEGDWSNLAPWLCAGALGGEGIHAKGASLDSLQGDKAIVEILKAYGAKVSVNKDGILVTKGEARPLSLDMSNIPDLWPVGQRAKAYFIMPNACVIKRPIDWSVWRACCVPLGQKSASVKIA